MYLVLVILQNNNRFNSLDMLNDKKLITLLFFLQSPHTNRYTTLFFLLRHQASRATSSKTMLHFD